MYKTRISDWDIRRNLRRSEREDACQELRQRWSSGEKISTIVVRGQEKNVAVLLQHMRDAKCPAHDRSTTRKQAWHIRTDIARPARPLYPAGDERSVEVICMQTVYVCQAFPIGWLSDDDGLYGAMSLAIDRARDSQFREAMLLRIKVGH